MERGRRDARTCYGPPVQPAQRRSATAKDEAFLRARLAPFGVDPRDLGALAVLEVPKRAHVLCAGDDPDGCGVVIEGVLREYYLQADGREHTRGFCLAGDAFGSLADALQGRRSAVFVRAEVRARVVLVPWSQVTALAREYLAWERLAAALVKDLYLRKSAREYELLALDAMGRYEALRARQPDLERLVPATLLASYLGITNVHLSRLRRRLRPRTR